MIYAWGLLAAVCIITIEIAYVHSTKWFDFWYIVFPAVLIGNLSIFNVIKGSSSILSAFILYSALTMIGRTLYALWAHQPLNMWIWLATSLMVMAMALRFMGAR